MSVRLLAVAFALISLVTGAPAGAAPCDRVGLPEPAVSVEVAAMPEPPIDRTLSVLDLTRLARSRSQGRSMGRVMGLTAADFRFGIDELRVGQVRTGDQICIAPTRIRLRLQASQTIYLVKSAQRDPCWEGAILEHERLHVGYNNDAVRAVAAAVEPRLRRLGPELVSPAEAHGAGERLAKSIDGIVNDAARQAFGTAAQRHAAIDTPAAYTTALTAMRRRCGP